MRRLLLKPPNVLSVGGGLFVSRRTLRLELDNCGFDALDGGVSNLKMPQLQMPQLQMPQLWMPQLLMPQL